MTKRHTQLLLLALLLPMTQVMGKSPCKLMILKPNSTAVPHDIHNKTNLHANKSKYSKNRHATVKSPSLAPNSKGSVAFDVASCDDKHPKQDLYGSASFDFHQNGKLVDICTVSVTSTCVKTANGIQKAVTVCMSNCVNENLEIKNVNAQSWDVLPKD